MRDLSNSDDSKNNSSNSKKQHSNNNNEMDRIIKNSSSNNNINSRVYVIERIDEDGEEQKEAAENSHSNRNANGPQKDEVIQPRIIVRKSSSFLDQDSSPRENLWLA